MNFAEDRKLNIDNMYCPIHDTFSQHYCKEDKKFVCWFCVEDGDERGSTHPSAACFITHHIQIVDEVIEEHIKEIQKKQMIFNQQLEKFKETKAEFTKNNESVARTQSSHTDMSAVFTKYNDSVVAAFTERSNNLRDLVAKCKARCAKAQGVIDNQNTKITSIKEILKNTDGQKQAYVELVKKLKEYHDVGALNAGEYKEANKSMHDLLNKYNNQVANENAYTEVTPIEQDKQVIAFIGVKGIMDRAISSLMSFFTTLLQNNKHYIEGTKTPALSGENANPVQANPIPQVQLPRLQSEAIDNAYPDTRKQKTVTVMIGKSAFTIVFNNKQNDVGETQLNFEGKDKKLEGFKNMPGYCIKGKTVYLFGGYNKKLYSVDLTTMITKEGACEPTSKGTGTVEGGKLIIVGYMVFDAKPKNEKLNTSIMVFNADTLKYENSTIIIKDILIQAPGLINQGNDKIIMLGGEGGLKIKEECCGILNSVYIIDLKNSTATKQATNMISAASFYSCHPYQMNDTYYAMIDDCNRAHIIDTVELSTLLCPVNKVKEIIMRLC